MIISVASGKGGTGKTLVATSLAMTIKNGVHLLDCDVEEPNAHVFLRPDFTGREVVSAPVPVIDEDKCTHCGICAEVCAFNAIAVMKKKVLVFPELCHSCGACSYLCPEKAISEKGREIGVVETGHANGLFFTRGTLNVGEIMAPPVIRKVKEQIRNGNVSIIDAPPGTSCPVIEAVKGSDFCILVTEPTPFGLNDLILAVEALRKLEIPHGVILNRAGVGDSGVQDYCRRENITGLLTIPLDNRIARNYSKGITLVEGLPEWRRAFQGMFDKVKEVCRKGKGH